MKVDGKFLEILRSRLSLAEIVGEKVKLTRKGREHTGLCPFHHEKTPSFTVSEEKEFYHCFGCGAHGDAVKFLVDAQHYTFIEAVKELAHRAGLSLPESIITNSPEKEPEDPAPLYQVMEEAAKWYHQNLSLMKNGHALRYAERRGLQKTTLKTFSLGWASGGSPNLKDYLQEKGYDEDLLLKAGLLVHKEGERPYERFRQRLMFPIHDPKGRVVAFGGRLLEKGEPKYLNSPETPLFSKGHLLYGYVFAKEKTPQEPLIIVEGYMDVIALHQGGYKGAVAPLGTALTEDQISLAWRLSPEPILCFDGDMAGLKAAARAAERVLPILKPGFSLRFALLPEGEDPDSLLQKGGAFREIIASPYSLIEMLWKFLTQGKSFKTPEQKAALQKQYMVWVQSIQNQDIRKNYLYAFKDFFYRDVIKIKEKNPYISSLRKANLNMPLIYVRLLLAILINHPNLIDETSDDLAHLDIEEANLCELREAILRYYTLDSKESVPLKEYLMNEGFENEIGIILSPQVLLHGSFANPAASIEEARAGWKEVFNHLQKRLSHSDIKEAQQDLADVMSEEAWNRLKMLKKSTFAQD